MSEERLHRAVRHVSQYQLPVNELLATQLQQKLKSEQISVTGFLRELGNDPGLFLRAVRNLLEEDSTPTDPIRALRARELQDLCALLERQPSRFVTHDLRESTPLQSEQYLSSALAVSTAETLAEAYAAPLTLSGEAVKAAALLRQIGYAFIAWNYPGLYEECICQAADGENLEHLLSGKLGFSPQMLAFRVLSSWGISPSYLHAIGLCDDEMESEHLTRSISQTLVTICKVGECLARAAQAQSYPERQKDWSTAQQALREQLGENGYSKVIEKFHQNIEECLELAPEIFHPGLILARIDEKADGTVEALALDNPFIAQCSLPLQRALREFYERLANSAESTPLISTLLYSVAPHSVLSGGIVYTIDPFRQVFAPQASFGIVKRSHNAEVSTLLTLSDGDVVTLAFQSPDLFAATETAIASTDVHGVASVIGRSQRIGVLYGECSEESLREDRAESDLKALAVAMGSALKLG